MKLRDEWKAAGAAVALFLVCYFLPVGTPRFEGAVLEALYLVHDYAREHVLLCLVPAFFIAGAIAVFIRQAAVMKYLGAEAPKVVAYGVASVSGTILAVCSCTVLPLFAGIYRMGAGLGPATAFLYAGPAINVLAIVLTARVLGWQLGVARAVGAVLFSIAIGLAMHGIFRREAQGAARPAVLPDDEDARPLGQMALYFGAMVAVLVFANWAAPAAEHGLWHTLYTWKWTLTAIAAGVLGLMLVRYYGVCGRKVAAVAVVCGLAASVPQVPAVAVFALGLTGLGWVAQTGSKETQAWLEETWRFAKQILPLLFAGVLVAGLLLGRPGGEGLIPAEWVHTLVGGNSVRATGFAAVAGAFMYFATLTEVPIVQGLLANGMGQGPALALLLAGPALSLPNMLVIYSVLGAKKTFAFVCLVILMATASGLLFGMLVS